MRTFLFLSFLWAICPLQGQSQFKFEPQADAEEEVASIHILYRIPTGAVAGYRLWTTFAPDDPVKLTPNSYTLLEVSEDYLGFFANGGEPEKPLIINIERGKHYFYRFTRFGLDELLIDELTEQEFKMELFFNGIKPESKRT
ncbi:MAG: hypothetical protein RIC19_23170 [Phaeodactylibacter sp.]|uniref:hypothetical protein n=1 Tax=Phaeodactylibacter sp. TaxID=1940289 RepID=UPI0032EC3DD0